MILISGQMLYYPQVINKINKKAFRDKFLKTL